MFVVGLGFDLGVCVCVSECVLLVVVSVTSTVPVQSVASEDLSLK